jgi:hypothetical protein
MRYMLLIYSTETTTPSPERHQRSMEGHRSAMADATRKGFLRGAEPLAPTSSATTLRVRDGQTVITDGPFAETKEQLAGYYLLECENLDDALEVARQIPTGCLGDEGCVEVRPIRALPAELEAALVSGAAGA